MMEKILTLILVAAAGSAGAANCPAVDPAAATCQQAIAKAGATYAKSRLKAVQKCLRSIQRGKLTGDPVTICRGTTGVPPTDPKTAASVTKAATKAQGAMARDCDDTSVTAVQTCSATVAGLGCVIDDHAAQVDAMIAAEFGAVTVVSDKGAQKCQGTIGNESGKLVQAQLRALKTCLDARSAACGGPGPRIRCLAPSPSGPPEEQALLTAYAAAEAQFREKLQKKCTDAATAPLATCADTATGLQDCLICAHRNATELYVGPAYRSVRVANATTSLQSVADAAETEDTILVAPGTYNQEMELKDSGLLVRGIKTCDTGARPLVLPPTPTTQDGIHYCGSHLPGCTDLADDVTLQSLEVDNFKENDVYAAGVEGATYLDMITRGPGTTGVTRYGLFPVQSNNVLLDGCVASGISDAGLYVGQSTNIIVRNCEVFGSVAGIEIENSGNAEVYDNYSHDNAGGILVFKLAGLSTQLSDCHIVRNNRTLNNNGPNYGAGIVGLVPSGTGIIVLSTDSSIVRDNLSNGNRTFGIAVVDQAILNLAFMPPPFPSPSPDQDVNDNSLVGNDFTGNAFDPDPVAAPFQADVTFVPLFRSGNCQNDNLFATDFNAVFAALPACPGTLAQPGCPVALPTTTSTTTTTTTPSTSTSTTTLPWAFSIQVQPLLGTRCGACHGGSGTPQYAGLDNLDNPALAYSEIVNVMSTELPAMDRIEPGSSTMSYLMHKLDGDQASVGGNGVRMPQFGPYLSASELDGIRGWIDDGAPNN
jgi:parallel beta-helix repeat protein